MSYKVLRAINNKMDWLGYRGRAVKNELRHPTCPSIYKTTVVKWEICTACIRFSVYIHGLLNYSHYVNVMLRNVKNHNQSSKYKYELHKIT